MGAGSKLLKATLVLAVVVGGVGAAYYAGVLPTSGPSVEEPSVTVVDIGDWGAVSEDRIEVVHTLNVRNPNPDGVRIGDATTVAVNLQLNGVRLGSVEKQGVDIGPGNNTVQVTSELRQKQISEFWARFINQGETIRANVSVSLTVDKGPGFTVTTPPVEVTALQDRKPLSAALDETGSEVEGTYTEEVDPDDLAEEYSPTSGSLTGETETVTAGYEVERLDFEWGTVTADRTELLIHVRLRNAGDVLLPGVPDGLSTDILLNDVEVFHASTESIALRNVDRDAVLLPGKSRSYTLVATADNQDVEEWFTTYASRRENSTVRTEFQLNFDLGDTSISVPREGSLAYECRFQTGIFVDDQNTSTTCLDEGTVEVGPAEFDRSDVTPTPTSTDTGDGATATGSPTDTATQTDDGGSRPTARIAASTTEGTAPLEVTFDASGSSDPDDDIVGYTWRFDDGSPPAGGSQVTHTFRTPGEYQVQLTVLDSQGNSHTTTVTVTVNGP
jgi:LEA14-like dessication related protein